MVDVFRRRIFDVTLLMKSLVRNIILKFISTLKIEKIRLADVLRKKIFRYCFAYQWFPQKYFIENYMELKNRKKKKIRLEETPSKRIFDVAYLMNGFQRNILSKNKIISYIQEISLAQLHDVKLYAKAKILCLEIKDSRKN